VALQSKDLTTQHLANIFAALARVAPRHPVTQTTILNLVPQCSNRVDAFRPQELAATLLAVAKVFGARDGHVDCGTYSACIDIDTIPAVPIVGAFGGRSRHAECGRYSACIDVETIPAVPIVVHQFFEAATPLVHLGLPNFSVASLASLAKSFAMMRFEGAQHLVVVVRDEMSKRNDRGSCRTDLDDLLDGLSLEEGSLPACTDTEKGTQDAAPDFLSSQTMRAGSSKQRRAPTRATVGSSALANQQESIHGVRESLGLAVVEGLYPRVQHASVAWAQGVGTEMLPESLPESDYSEEVDVDPHRMSTPWPTPQANEAWELPGYAPQVVGRLQACTSTHLVDNAHTGCGRGGIFQSPLVEGCLQSPIVQWKCSVRNSFLHLEMACDNSTHEDQGSWGRGSSRRSSSVPSHFGHTGHVEEWYKRCASKSQE